VEVGDFVRPRFDGGLNSVAIACAGRQVLAEWTECASGVLEHTVVGPLLSCRLEIIGPGQCASTVLRTDGVVGIEVTLLVGCVNASTTAAATTIVAAAVSASIVTSVVASAVVTIIVASVISIIVATVVISFVVVIVTSIHRSGFGCRSARRLGRRRGFGDCLGRRR
jgi:hypothetical protein